MVGVDKPNEMECHAEVIILRPCADGNGEMTVKDFEVGGGKGIVKGAALCPITPVPCRENGETVSTPLSVVSPQSPSVEGCNCTSSDEVVVSGCDGSPRTPKEGVFNPFAPGPEELLLAPYCKKIVSKSRRIVARRLNFDDAEDDFPEGRDDDDKDEDSLAEEVLFKAVYGTLLEAIISKQTEDFLANNGPLESEGCHTPTSPRPLTGIAETCPGAPVKAVAQKAKNLDPGLCRKLEF